ncbi:prolipoprotein diacylglyceryl transferase, partial [Saccharomonospora saliphila]|uniref:hypothetical protein n=1 Tax=Saccharomonospora saliphila TaxID=369829 RepID=UPI000371853D
GQLPLPGPEGDAGGDAALRRIKVTLTPPAPDPERPTDPGRAVPSPSVPDGLGKFDLGSVPASVTPPTTWRRAAWFAGLSSTAVVVALLVAGTVLVGGTDEQSRAAEGWPDRTGRLSIAPDQGSPADARVGDDDARGGDTAVPGSDAADETATEDRRAALRAAHTTDTAPEPAEQRSGDTDGGGPTTSPAPSKPPVTPASTSAAPRVLWASHDTETLARRSQDYFNLVTEDPSAAHDLTTGELAELGPEGLAERYADIAYFEVREVYIDAGEGITHNTVRVTYPDGSTAEETRTLEFGDDDRIAAEGG